jgi:hypothetical protein
LPDALDCQSFRANVRRLAETRIAPHAASVDDETRFPIQAREAFKPLKRHSGVVREKMRYGGAQVLASERDQNLAQRRTIETTAKAYQAHPTISRATISRMISFVPSRI